MKEVLLTLLSLTLSGSLLCALVLLLRPVTGNRVPRAVSYYLWLAVLLRFLIPFGYGITLPQLPQPTQEMVQQETILPERQDQTDTQTAPITPPSEPITVDQPEITQPSAPAISLPGMLVFLWLAVGAGFFFFWHIAAYARFSHRVRASLAPPTAEALALFEGLDHSRRIRLACSSHVNAPMLLGVFRPVIVLPQGGPSLPPQALAAPLCQKGKRLKARLLGIKGYRRPGKAAICLTLVLGLAVACCACTVVDMNPQPRAAAGESDPYQPLLIEYELAFLQQQPDAYPDLVSAVIAPYWGQDHQLGYARRDLDGDSSEELLLGWVGNEFWNLDQGYVFAIYTLVDGQPVLAVEGWERSLYVVREDNILCHNGSSGAGRTAWNQYRFDPSSEGYLALLDHVSEPEDGEEAWTIGDSWMDSGVSLPYICFAGREESPYQDVLLGQAPFLYVDGSGQKIPTFLPDIPLAFSPYSSYASVTEFAILDLDGDGSQEVVLRVTDVANDMGGYVVLRQEGDEIRGYPSHWRTFWYLKTDGTFTYSYTAGTEDGIASARFGEDGLTLEKHIRCEMEAWEPKAFEVDGRPVSQTEYEAACSAQDQKADAVWYELNETNIQQLTA
ncbi:M56 family metallopeptidase [uncultured Flavonifractor sp.]|uniref:M56 family metallopeptidase n=1 Tax=uncultured Flavonifractor sp. TaxID=1193534 RepID=UPI00266FE2DD|nr:M56 family metallopeptidase [uncultured Flavonifractor sp.]